VSLKDRLRRLEGHRPPTGPTPALAGLSDGRLVAWLRTQPGASALAERFQAVTDILPRDGGWREEYLQLAGHPEYSTLADELLDPLDAALQRELVGAGP
jgi:hypothetical protein